MARFYHGWTRGGTDYFNVRAGKAVWQVSQASRWPCAGVDQNQTASGKKGLAFAKTEQAATPAHTQNSQ
jgi:hypothetical protein